MRALCKLRLLSRTATAEELNIKTAGHDAGGMGGGGCNRCGWREFTPEIPANRETAALRRGLKH